MVVRKKEGSLTAHEKKIVKTLLGKGLRNQDIQALVNIGRVATVNSARISEVKKNQNQKAASEDETTFYEIKKRAYDPRTGLNLFDDERLIRAREAMVLAVQIFNSSIFQFKAETFSILVNVAWTYLLHEFYVRKKVNILGQDGRTLLLSQMIKRNDCPLSEGAKNNLESIKEIRDEVEHNLLGKADVKWLPLFQACCLNFDKAMCKNFSDKLTLAHELSFALQFGQMNIDQASLLQKYEIPQNIEALDARLQDKLTEDQLADLEYQFRVIYTLDSASKSKSHYEFIQADSDEAEEFRNILLKHKIADQLYPHKPGRIVALVKQKSGEIFNSRDHTQAWRFFKVRPPTKSKQPENTNKDYCIYHAAHKDYTYFDKWVGHLVEQVKDPKKISAIKGYKPKN